MGRTLRPLASALSLLLLGSAALAQEGVDVGLVRGSIRITNGDGGFEGTLADGDELGSSIAFLGDVDDDGNPDLAVGAEVGLGGFPEGAFWILFLNADGTVREERRISAGLSGFVGPLVPGDRFGSGLAGLGDLDMDGVPDVAVGAPGTSDDGLFTGAVWILFLNADGTVKGEQKISATSGGLPAGLSAFDFFGTSLAAVTSMSKRGGTTMLGVGAPGGGLLIPGSAWILFLNSDGTVSAAERISEGDGGFPGTLGLLDAFGAGMAALGDLDANGTPDFAVGAPGTGFFTGAVWILFLMADGSVASANRIDSSNGGFVEPLEQGDLFGRGLGPLGNLDDDTELDLAVGAPGDDGTGALYQLFLNADGTVDASRKIGSTEGWEDAPLSADDRFGFSVTALPDVDGDELFDLAVGAPGTIVEGDAAGAAYILFQRSPEETISPIGEDNPLALLPGLQAPRIGTVWDPIIDFPAAEPAGAPPQLGGQPLIDFLGVSGARAQPEVPLPSNVIGELAISLLGGDLLATLVVPAGERFSFPIASDVSLVGFVCYTQGIRWVDDGTLLLTNGLDAVVGY